MLLWFSDLQFVLSGFAHDHMDVGGRVTHGAVTEHLASHFGKSFSNHSYRYDFSNDLPLDRSPGAEKHMDVRERPLDRSPGVAEHMDVRERPNCFASYSTNSGSLVKYAG